MSDNPKVVFEIRMDPQEYARVENDAKWYGMSASQYLVACALGTLPRGC